MTTSLFRASRLNGMLPLVAVCFIAIILGAPAAFGQWNDTGLIQNNSFEANGLPPTWPYYTGTISNWTLGGAGHMINSDASGPFHEVGFLGNVPNGTYVAGNQGAGTLSQALSGLVNGRWYRLDFYVNERYSDTGVMDAKVTLGTQVVFPQTTITPQNPYRFYQQVFQYNGSGTTSSIPTFEDIVQVKQFGYGVRYCNLGSLEKVVSNSGEGEDAFCDGICLEGFSKTL